MPLLIVRGVLGSQSAKGFFYRKKFKEMGVFKYGK